MGKKVFKVNEGTGKKRIEMACLKSGITLTELGNGMGANSTTIFSKSTLGKISMAEFDNMAEVLGCRYVCRFIMPDGTTVERNGINLNIEKLYNVRLIGDDTINEKINGITYNSEDSELVSSSDKTIREIYRNRNGNYWIHIAITCMRHYVAPISERQADYFIKMNSEDR